MSFGRSCPRPGVGVVRGLAEALSAEHPESFTVGTERQMSTKMKADLGESIRAAARAALELLSGDPDPAAARAARDALAAAKR